MRSWPLLSLLLLAALAIAGCRTPWQSRVPPWLTKPQAPRSADADLVVVVNTKRYYVKGNSYASIREDLADYGPEIGRWAVASVGWEVSFRYDVDVDGGGCRPKDPRVKVNVQYVMPDWVDNGNKRIAKSWRRFRRNLLTHEHGHAVVGVRAGEGVLRMLRDAESMSDCKELETTLAQRARRIVEEHHAINAEYDRVTKHGQEQGTQFPPQR